MKQNVLLLKANKTYQILQVKVKKGKLHFSKRIQEHPVDIEPDHVLEEDKPSWKFWRNPKRLIVHFEGSLRSLKLMPETQEVDMGFLTLDDIIKAVKTAIVKALTQFKPMKMSQFVILALIGVANLILMFYGFNRMGIL